MTTTAPVPSLATEAVKRMTVAANDFLNSLDDSQRNTASFEFAGDERYMWAYTPIERDGLRVRVMSDSQRDAAFRLMETAYSARGSVTAHRIIELETILGEWEMIQDGKSNWERNIDRYWFSVFGSPGSVDEPWGFRVGGHHIGLSANIINGDQVAILPLFFGANPAEIRHGDRIGERTLVEEQDWARALLTSLDGDQTKMAVVDAIAPADILTTNVRSFDPNIAPKGIEFSALGDGQRDQLVKLVKHYITRAADDLSSNYWRELEAAGFDGTTFAWAGPAEVGEGHYYAIRHPRFLIEYDNTQNGANHIHSVLRDFTHDWGEDLLAAHYRASH
ncbi:MAG TPA: DUF3500 domain-containing protein [Dehalococcoidia bacterium]|nr:DUF3500 domain-containing protein [Dehalococcoidia bacterium]HIK88301.1 DUF3500 domain-containing protein [Dehalococcoidia bacterium]